MRIMSFFKSPADVFESLSYLKVFNASSSLPKEGLYSLGYNFSINCKLNWMDWENTDLEAGSEILDGLGPPLDFPNRDLRGSLNGSEAYF